MINVEGYKIFKGIMQITPGCKEFKPFVKEGEWLYKPECNCWYCNDSSYPASTCEILKDHNKYIDKNVLESILKYLHMYLSSIDKSLELLNLDLLDTKEIRELDSLIDYLEKLR